MIPRPSWRRNRSLHGGRRRGEDQPSSEGSTRAPRGGEGGRYSPLADKPTPEKPSIALAETIELPCSVALQEGQRSPDLTAPPLPTARAATTPSCCPNPHHPPTTISTGTIGVPSTTTTPHCCLHHVDDVAVMAEDTGPRCRRETDARSGRIPIHRHLIAYTLHHHEARRAPVVPNTTAVWSRCRTTATLAITTSRTSRAAPWQ